MRLRGQQTERVPPCHHSRALLTPPKLRTYHPATAEHVPPRHGLALLTLPRLSTFPPHHSRAHPRPATASRAASNPHGNALPRNSFSHSAIGSLGEAGALPLTHSDPLALTLSSPGCLPFPCRQNPLCFSLTRWWGDSGLSPCREQCTPALQHAQCLTGHFSSCVHATVLGPVNQQTRSLFLRSTELPVEGRSDRHSQGRCL